MVRVDLKHIHKVKRKLVDGSVRKHHYAWRGGPSFWSSDSDIVEGSAEYVAAFAASVERPARDGLQTPQMVDAYLDSAEHQNLAVRTTADYRKWALRFAKEFEADPAAMFEEPESRGEVNTWRQQWAHSPKQFDYAGTVATVILNWARDNGKIRQHHCDRLKKIYSADRAQIVWTPADIEKFNARAPKWAQRILAVAVETGLRPGDLVRLSWSHIEDTPGGRRVKIRTNKRGRIASIPVTPGLAEILADTPRNRMLILTSQRGKPLTEHRASEGIRQWRDKAVLSSDLRLQDARGTAATRLLRQNLALAQIASWMGWSLRFAQNVIERYAAVAPDDSDEILVLLNQARAAKTRTEV